jgi:hypothetical protein
LAFLIIDFKTDAAEPEWRVGLAAVKITPERPIFLAGYDETNRSKKWKPICTSRGWHWRTAAAAWRCW